MQRPAWIPALTFLLLPSIARGQGKFERAEPNDKAPRGQALEWSSEKGKPFVYRLPARIDPLHPPRLLLMLHGAKQSWTWAFAYHPIISGEFRPTDIVIAPEALAGERGESPVFRSDRPDGEQIAGIVQAFKKQFPVGSVYLYGLGEGAVFAYWFLGEYPDLVDGIVAHNGALLDGKLPKQGRERYGIAILHARADSVIPADYALQAEEKLRKEGFRNVKVSIAQGLDKKTAHEAALPKEVSDLLAWLDRLCAGTPEAALSTALSEIAKDSPEIGVAAAMAERAGELARGAKGPNQAALEERLGALRALLEEVRAAHVKALAADPAYKAAKPPFGFWTVHFRVANQAFRGMPAWQEAMKAFVKLADSQEKAVGAALKGLSNPKRSAFQSAVAALEAGYMAPSYDELLELLKPLADRPGELEYASEADLKRLRSLVQARNEFEWTGRKSGRDAQKEILARFREAHKDWFPPADEEKAH